MELSPMNRVTTTLLLVVGISILPCIAHAVPLVRSIGGSNPASIQATVEQFRADLGVLNPNVAGSFAGGRREINWDGVPDAFAAPFNLPPDFFNVNSPRGVVFTTPGTGLPSPAFMNCRLGVPVREPCDSPPAAGRSVRFSRCRRAFR